MKVIVVPYTHFQSKMLLEADAGEYRPTEIKYKMNDKIYVYKRGCCENCGKVH